jgi:hypothetical protein
VYILLWLFPFRHFFSESCMYLCVFVCFCRINLRSELSRTDEIHIFVILDLFLNLTYQLDGFLVETCNSHHSTQYSRRVLGEIMNGCALVSGRFTNNSLFVVCYHFHEKTTKGHSRNCAATYNVELRQLSLFYGTISHVLRH